MLSVIILTKNSERYLQRCLSSVLFCDEIIVIDDYSDDDTLMIAKEFGCKIFFKNLDSNYSAQRNFGLNKASGDWILFVDSDEVVTESLKTEILKSIDHSQYSGYCLTRQDILWGKRMFHGESGQMTLVRLGKKDCGHWHRAVHEIWQIDGKVGVLHEPLLHYAHSDLFEFIKKVNDYSVIHANENLKEGKRSSLAKIILYPPAKFIYNYIVKLGFLDGTRGCVVSLVMSFHSFLSWSNLWLIQKNHR
jgi:glycosyltransferase involved in cell wall biosynthesis